MDLEGNYFRREEFLRNKRFSEIILALAKEHKEKCDGQCGFNLSELRPLIRDLNGRGLMQEESDILI